MKKKIPIFRTDEEAEAFVETADLTEFNLTQFKRMRFEFEKKELKPGAKTAVKRGAAAAPVESGNEDDGDGDVAVAAAKKTTKVAAKKAPAKKAAAKKTAARKTG